MSRRFSGARSHGAARRRRSVSMSSTTGLQLSRYRQQHVLTWLRLIWHSPGPRTRPKWLLRLANRVLTPSRSWLESAYAAIERSFDSLLAVSEERPHPSSTSPYSHLTRLPPTGCAIRAAHSSCGESRGREVLSFEDRGRVIAEVWR
jgi:hypothetical protein